MAASQTEDQSIIFDKYFEEKLISMGVPIEIDFETTLAPKFDWSYMAVNIIKE